eukprot:scaffold74613_cov66-Phaeocystis_antarctica.AAC.1
MQQRLELRSVLNQAREEAVRAEAERGGYGLGQTARSEHHAHLRASCHRVGPWSARPTMGLAGSQAR